MNRGYFKTWRKITDSAVFQNEGLLKVFIWSMARAAYRETFVTVRTGRGVSEVKLLPGQFIFGRESAAQELNMKPSTAWKRMLKLKNLEILNIESNSHYSIITIVNWDTYQCDHEKRNSESNRQGTGKEHKEEIEALKKNITPSGICSQIEVLQERYSDQEIINQVFQAIASTRKSNRIADSVKLSIFQSWDQYPAEQVISGIKTYLEKGCAEQGKGEKYLLGIIRNAKTELHNQKESGKPTMQSSGSPKLDNYYRNQGHEVRP